MDRLTQLFLFEPRYYLWRIVENNVTNAKIDRSLRKDRDLFEDEENVLYPCSSKRLEFFETLLNPSEGESISNKVRLLMEQDIPIDIMTDSFIDVASLNKAEYMIEIYKWMFKNNIDPNGSSWMQSEVFSVMEMYTLIEKLIRRRSKAVSVCLEYGGEIRWDRLKDRNIFTEEDETYAKSFDVPDTKGAIMEDV